MKHFRVGITVALILMAAFGRNDVNAALNITADTTWPAGTYEPSGNLIISNNAVLTIAPGAIVKMGADALISVGEGSLVATGVTFTWALEGQQWEAIDFGSLDMSGSRLEDCVIEHAKGRFNSGAVIEISWGTIATGSPTITGCTIGGGDATRGIYVNNASPQILNNHFTGFSDAAVHLQSGRSSTVTGNTFEGNTVGVHIYYSAGIAPTVTGNTYSGSTEADVRVNGTIYADVAWNEGPDTVYLVAPGTGGFGIRENGRLTITDGITVKVNPDVVISVGSGGSLAATGVTFTWAIEGQQWEAIDFGSLDMSGSRLEDCVIEYAKGRSVTGAMIEINWGNIATGSPTITGCTIGGGDAPRGIFAGNASPQILSNTFTGFSDAAVHLPFNTSATVTGNTFDGNAVGVYIYYGSNFVPTVSGNTYLGSTVADVRVSGRLNKKAVWNEDPGTVYNVASDTGVFPIDENGHLTITDGIIVKVNPDKVIWLQTGGILEAMGVTFTTADEFNEWDGIWFFRGDSRSRLENCVIERAKGRSSNGSAMIYVENQTGGSSPSIIGCTIGNGSAPRGIYVSDASPKILGNALYGFSDYGVYVTIGQSAPFIAGNTITGNHRGIGSFTIKKMVSRVNHIEGNVEYGFFTGESDSYAVADARYNWWGSATGPTFTGNPLGTGDAITTKVDYVPFFGSIADIEPDGIWDAWEIQNFTDTMTATESSDFDNDGLLDAGEFLYGTDPKNSDSDGDGVFDGLEIQCFLNPLLSGDFGLDSDNDGFSDLRELIAGTDQWDNADIPEIIADGEPPPSGDGDVDGKDLMAFMAEIGSFTCPTCRFDLDQDGDVDRADLFLLTEDFGRIN